MASPQKASLTTTGRPVTFHTRAPRTKTVHFEHYGDTLCGLWVHYDSGWAMDLADPVSCPKCLAALRKNEREVRENRARQGLPELEATDG